MPPRPTLAAVLRRRSRAEVVAFVAALYAARGAETTVDEGAAVVDGERYVVVASGVRGRLREWFGTAPSTADRVLVVDGDADSDAPDVRYDAPVLTPADLDDLARYGLDRETADAVFRDHFGVTLDDVAHPPEARSGDGSDGETASARSSEAGADDDGMLGSVPVAAAVVVALLAVVVLSTTPGAIGLSGGPFDADEGSTAAGTASPNTAEGTADAGASDPTDTETGGTDEPLLAPGLTTEGVVDPTALADAHAAAVTNRSYTWRLTYVESVNGDEVGRATETVRVAEPAVYVSNVTREGFLVPRGPLSSWPAYADGERRYRLTADEVDVTELADDTDTGEPAARARQYVLGFVNGREMSVGRTVSGGPRRYVVEIEGTNTSGIRNYTATAHVSSEGLVYFFSGSYCLTPVDDDRRQVCLSLTMRYADVGATTVEPPSWYTAWNTTTATPTEVSNATSTASPTPTPSSSSPPAGTATPTPAS